MQQQASTKRRNRIYWICQILGWGIFTGGNLLNLFVQGKVIPDLIVYLILMFITGITITHIFRGFAQKWNWASLGILPLLPRVFMAVIAMSLIFTTIVGGINDLMPRSTTTMLSLSSPDFIVTLLNFAFIFALWAIIYFGVHYFENQRKAEIRNLELRAVNTEVELSNLRNQLRPHFMFNSLNSIRALIDEDPKRAKHAVTGLSAVLRSTLLLGKHRTIAFSEEMELVNKYLEIEGIRFEERLDVESNIGQNTLEHPVPPLIAQVLVENAIKHGIAKRREGGSIKINAKKERNILIIEIRNTGSLNGSSTAEGTATGLENIKKRLNLLYGDRAQFVILEKDGEVCCKLEIPAL